MALLERSEPSNKSPFVKVAANDSFVMLTPMGRPYNAQRIFTEHTCMAASGYYFSVPGQPQLQYRGGHNTAEAH